MTSNKGKTGENGENDGGDLEPKEDIIENIREGIMNVIPHLDESIQRRGYILEQVAREIMIKQKEKKDKERKDRKRLYGLDNAALEIIRSLHNQWRPKVSREFIITAAKRKGYSLLNYMCIDAIIYIDDCNHKIFTDKPLSQFHQDFVAGGTSRKTEHYWADDETDAVYGSMAGDLDVKLIDNLFISFAVLGDSSLPDAMKDWPILMATRFEDYIVDKLEILNSKVSRIDKHEISQNRVTKNVNNVEINANGVTEANEGNKNDNNVKKSATEGRKRGKGKYNKET